MMLYLRLFYEFFKTGLFSIGGGMATIPFLYQMSDATHWFTYDDLANMIAVSESTPGPIGVNMATYVGYVTGANGGDVLHAVLGAAIATLGLITPSIIIILIIAGFLKSFRDNKYVNNAFYGLRPASTGLIAAAGLGVVSTCLLKSGISIKEINLSSINWNTLDWLAINWIGIVLGIVLWLLTNKVKKTKGLHPIVFIAASAVVGVIFKM